MSKYFISFLLVINGMVALAQPSKTVDLNPKDSVVYKQKYGLRIGVDLGRPILGLFDDNFSGFEFVADYRLKQNLFIAAELGNETNSDSEDVGSSLLYDFTVNGNYLKLGADFNIYGNWYGEQNFITVGGRYAFSSFDQTLNSFRVFNSNRFFNPTDFTELITTPEEFNNLSASWIEVVLGVKIELFKNIYANATIRLGYLVSNKEDERFPNLYIPGFNRVTDGSDVGFNYNYSISYFIPLYKKVKVKKRAPQDANSPQE